MELRIRNNLIQRKTKLKIIIILKVNYHLKQEYLLIIFLMKTLMIFTKIMKLR